MGVANGAGVAGGAGAVDCRPKRCAIASVVAAGAGREAGKGKRVEVAGLA